VACCNVRVRCIGMGWLMHDSFMVLDRGAGMRRFNVGITVRSDSFMLLGCNFVVRYWLVVWC